MITLLCFVGLSPPPSPLPLSPPPIYRIERACAGSELSDGWCLEDSPLSNYAAVPYAPTPIMLLYPMPLLQLSCCTLCPYSNYAAAPYAPTPIMLLYPMPLLQLCCCALCPYSSYAALPYAPTPIMLLYPMPLLQPCC